MPYQLKENANIESDLNEFLHDIGNELYNEISRNITSANCGLFGGMGGILLFLFYYEKYFVSQAKNHKAEYFLDVFLENLDTQAFTYSNGLAGIGWLIEHLIQKKFINCKYRDILHDLDDDLEPVMFEELNAGNYDYLHGATGCFFYYLKRKSNIANNSQRILKYCALLEKNADFEDDNQIYWNSFVESKKDISNYNLGLSHGIPSITYLLLKAYKSGYQGNPVINLINKSIFTILNSKNTDSNCLSLYPYTKSGQNKPSRLSWCYGDLGISSTLLNAGKLRKRADWTEKGIDALRHSLNRKDLIENSVFDTGFCHGSVGILHIYNRLFRINNLSFLKQGVDYWAMETLKFKTFDDGLAGLKFYNSEKYENNYSLLVGIAGVGLVLVSLLSKGPHSFDWDECLLLS